MPAPIKTTICAGLLCSIIAACGSGGSSDGGNPLPTGSAIPLASDDLAFDSDRTGNYEIFIMKTDGSGARQLTHNATYDSWWPRISPDRRKILFYRTPKGVHDSDYSKTSLWLMNADGSSITRLRSAGANGWVLQGHGEWSPDGTEIVMFGGSSASPQIYVTNADGTHPRRVTDGTGYWLDPSWSPDGTRVVATGCTTAPCPGSTLERLEIYTMPADGSGTLVRVTNDTLRDHDPYYSPDGTVIAWLTLTDPTIALGVWNIRRAAPDGSGLGNVTNDNNINSKPDWSPDGAFIYFHRLVYGGTPSGFNIYQIQPNGVGLTLLPGQIGNNEFPDN